MKLRPVATWSPVVGFGLGAWLVWAFAARHDDWNAWSFALLFYGGVICTVAAHVAALLARRRGETAPPEFATELRRALSAVVLVAVLWVWCKPVMEPVVGWWMRQSSMWRFR